MAVTWEVLIGALSMVGAVFLAWLSIVKEITTVRTMMGHMEEQYRSFVAENQAQSLKLSTMDQRLTVLETVRSMEKSVS